MKADRRFSGGLTVTTSFTYSKAMSFQTGDDGGLYFYYQPQIRRGYARADFDRTLNFVQSYVYQLPFGKGKPYLRSGIPGKVLGGWSVSGILSWRTGTPFSITGTNGLNMPSSASTATIDGNLNILGGIGKGAQWFDISNIYNSNTYNSTTGVAVFGNTGRNEFTGPNLFSLNAGVRRQFTLNERIKMEVRAEALNATNTPQFSNPSAATTSSTFGQITGTLSSGTGVNGTGGGRDLNLSAKISF